MHKESVRGDKWVYGIFRFHFDLEVTAFQGFHKNLHLLTFNLRPVAGKRRRLFLSVAVGDVYVCRYWRDQVRQRNMTGLQVEMGRL